MEIAQTIRIKEVEPCIAELSWWPDGTFTLAVPGDAGAVRAGWRTVLDLQGPARVYQLISFLQRAMQKMDQLHTVEV